MGGIGSRIARLDAWQQRRPAVAFPLAVLQKYSDDQGGYLAATLTYFAFFSIFPLLLVLTTVLGFVLDGHPGLYDSIVDSALGQLPVIGDELQRRGLDGSALGLAFGLAVALWSGMRVFLAAQNAMNHVWGVPHVVRPSFVRARLRALVLLAVLGGGMLVATGLAALSSIGAGYGLPWKAGSVALSVALDIGLVWVALRVLTARDVTWRELRGGAIAGGVAYALLQALGGLYIGHVLEDSSNAYGTFALVIGLLSWIALGATILLLAAEANAVATLRLWPRSIPSSPERPPTEGDRRALTLKGDVEQRRADEDVRVEIPAERPAKGA